MDKNEFTSPKPMISPEALELLGGGKLAYVKAIRSEDVQNQFPQAPDLAPGTLLYALHAADGTPIMLMRRPTPGTRSASVVALSIAIASLIEGSPAPVNHWPRPILKPLPPPPCVGKNGRINPANAARLRV